MKISWKRLQINKNITKQELGKTHDDHQNTESYCKQANKWRKKIWKPIKRTISRKKWGILYKNK